MKPERSPSRKIRAASDAQGVTRQLFRALLRQMRGAPDIELPSFLDEALRRCVACCRQTIETYAAKADPDPEFASTLLAVVAALELALQTEPTKRQRALTAAEEIARDAAAKLRRYGIDGQILRCAATCDEAAHRLRAALQGKP